MSSSPVKSEIAKAPIITKTESTSEAVTANKKVSINVASSSSNALSSQSKAVINKTTTQEIKFDAKQLSTLPSSTSPSATSPSLTDVTTSRGKYPGRTTKSSHPHRLIRQHSLAAVLGLFRSSTTAHRDEIRGVPLSTLAEWGVVKEEQEGQERTSGTGNSRSFSIPSSSGAQLPQEPKRKIRRSSIHTDLADGNYIIGSVPAVLAVKKKPVDTDPRPITTRRCSLTLPYANLYGSWQSTISPPGSSRHVNSDNTGNLTRRTHSPVEHSQIGDPMKYRKAHSQNTLSKQTSLSVPLSDNLKSSPSTLPLLLTTSSLEEAAEEEEIDDVDSELKLKHKTHISVDIPESVIQLMACTFQKVPMKDFGSEVRATMDIEHFLQTAVLLVDVQETSLEGITDLLLEKVLSQDEPLCTITEAKSILFTHDTSSSNEKDALSQVHLLARTIQGTACSESGSFDYDQSWICALGNLPSLQRRHVAIARLKQPANMGRTSKQVKFFILVLCPSKEKGTKNSLETGRTFATIFADMDFRQRLQATTTEEEFKRLIISHSQELAQEQQLSHDKQITINHDGLDDMDYQQEERKCPFARGIREDLERRLPHYVSDYKDGLIGNKTVQKVVSTTFFLYFACILPAIAFGVLNDHNTHGKIDVKKVIIGQVIGGVFWGLFSGQPLLVQLTTAPLAIYIKIIYYICEDFGLDFHATYCAVGLWNSFFLIVYSLFDVSRLMRWSTRSTEEIFALFISIAFCNDAFNDVRKNFDANYYSEACQNEKKIELNRSQSEYVAYLLGGNVSTYSPLTTYIQNQSSNATLVLNEATSCTRENSILYLLLMFGTLWLGVMLYNFNKTPYLNANKREVLADYALPVAVIVLSFIGSYIFREVKLEHFRYDDSYNVFQFAPLHSLPIPAVFATMGLGFSLSMLFFMDQNIGSAMVNNPCNKLKKGPAYHLDLFVVAFMNGFLSIFGLPWMHACLPHSPLHVRSLADVEERVDQGHVYEIIVKVRETRLTGLFSNILIGLSIFLLPYPLAYIPTAVLDGLFLYMAVTALNGNQMFERITLLFMEQAAYPPNHYIRRVPQRKIHKFTGLQVVQLLVMCSFGFAPWPYMKMMFPVLLLLLLPVRHRLVPLLIEGKYLAALDGQHQ